MINYDKLEVRKQLTDEQVHELLIEFGGDPEWTDFGIISSTICHNVPGEGSRKLYFYSNTGLFRCYTDCGESFDIFELVVKVANIQFHKNYDLNDAVRFIAYKFGIAGKEEIEIESANKEDWKIFGNYERISNIEIKNLNVELKEYNSNILKSFLYNVKIGPWLKEGIKNEVLKKAKIGFYPVTNQITIPHYDAKGRLVGLRGRTLIEEDADRLGKYMPIKLESQWFSHPLGMNLYNLNHSKKQIAIFQKAIVFESEKSTLQYRSYFGEENDISVACCGSNVSAYQIQMLINAGAKEIIIAFDRQFKTPGDEEHKRLVKNYKKLYNRFKNEVLLSFIIDKKMITSYKASPTDEGPKKFLQLFKERVVL